MWALTVRLTNASGSPLAGHRVTAAFQLRLAGAGSELMMPAEAVGVSDAAGNTTLNLPSPDSLGDTIRVSVRDPDGRVVHEIERPRAGLGSELLLAVGAPTAPTVLAVRVLQGGRPLPDTNVVILGRAEGAASFSLVLAGKTDASGTLQGPYPPGAFVEASALVQVDGNQTLPVHLEAGTFPAQITLSLQDLVAPPPPQLPPPVQAPQLEAAPVPPPQPARPSLSPSSATPVPLEPGYAVPVPLSTSLSMTTNPSIDDDDEDGQRSRRRRSRPVMEELPDQLVYGLLALIIVVGAILRFYQLDGPSLWHDELSSWRRAALDTLSKVVMKGALPDVHPPGYYLILHEVIGVSDSEWAMRFPSALAGVISLGVIFLLGRRIWSAQEGLIAAGLMAVMWAPIRFSQEVRAYSFLILVTMLAVWAWMNLLREVERRGRATLDLALWYVLPASALTYLHYFGVLVVGLQGMGAFIYAGSRRHRHGALLHLAGVYLAVALLYLPWMGPFLEDLTQSESWMSDPSDDDQSSLWFYLRFLFNHRDGLVLYMMALLVGSGAWYLYRERGKVRFTLRTRWGMVLLWAMGPFLVTWVQSVLSTPVLSNRNLLISAPAFYLLIGRAITALPLRPVYRLGVAVVTVGLAALTFGTKHYYENPMRQQYREIAQYVVDHEDKVPDAIVVSTDHKHHFDYYLERLGGKSRVDVAASSKVDMTKLMPIIEEKQPKNVWRLRAGGDKEKFVDDYLAEHYRAADEVEYWGTSLTLYKKKKGGEGEIEEGLEEEAEATEEIAEEPEEKPASKAKKGAKAAKAGKAAKEKASPDTEDAETQEAPKKKAKKDGKKGGKAAKQQEEEEEAEKPETG